jgi:hypothetical protein
LGNTVLLKIFITSSISVPVAFCGYVLMVNFICKFDLVMRLLDIGQTLFWGCKGKFR